MRLTAGLIQDAKVTQLRQESANTLSFKGKKKLHRAPQISSGQSSFYLKWCLYPPVDTALLCPPPQCQSLCVTHVQFGAGSLFIMLLLTDNIFPLHQLEIRWKNIICRY